MDYQKVVAKALRELAEQKRLYFHATSFAEGLDMNVGSETTIRKMVGILSGQPYPNTGWSYLRTGAERWPGSAAHHSVSASFVSKARPGIGGFEGILFATPSRPWITSSHDIIRPESYYSESIWKFAAPSVVPMVPLGVSVVPNKPFVSHLPNIWGSGAEKLTLDIDRMIDTVSHHIAGNERFSYRLRGPQERFIEEVLQAPGLFSVPRVGAKNEIPVLSRSVLSNKSATEMEYNLGVDIGEMETIPSPNLEKLGKYLFKWAMKPAETVEAIQSKLAAAGTFGFVSHARGKEELVSNILRGHIATGKEILGREEGPDYLSTVWGTIRSGYSKRDVGAQSADAFAGGGFAHMASMKQLFKGGQVSEFHDWESPWLKISNWMKKAEDVEPKEISRIVKKPLEALQRGKVPLSTAWENTELNVYARVEGDLPRISLEDAFHIGERGTRRTLFERAMEQGVPVEKARGLASRIIEYPVKEVSMPIMEKDVEKRTLDIAHVYASMGQYAEEVPILFRRASEDADRLAREYSSKLGKSYGEMIALPPAGSKPAQKLRMEVDLGLEVGELGKVLPPAKWVFGGILDAAKKAEARTFSRGWLRESVEETARITDSATRRTQRYMTRLASELKTESHLDPSGLNTILKPGEAYDVSGAAVSSKVPAPAWGMVEPQVSPMREIRQIDNATGGAWKLIRQGDSHVLGSYPASLPESRQLIESTAGIGRGAPDIMERSSPVERGAEIQDKMRQTALAAQSERRMGEMTEDALSGAYDEAVYAGAHSQRIPEPTGVNPYEDVPQFRHTVRIQRKGQQRIQDTKRILEEGIERMPDAIMSSSVTYNRGTVNVPRVKEVLNNVYGVS